MISNIGGGSNAKLPIAGYYKPYRPQSTETKLIN